ncbi:MAG TPA: ATP-dependent exonuclease SbcCD, C subunit-like protein, partial [Desulfobulbaceae bacterium]|nr:ATP-dependent exonuclease SbcCD, C subunit-like protein [Desulfobulbaceae bacterium]
RLLRNFGLSLLVAPEYYAKVNHYVERTNLKGRLVYFRVDTKQRAPVTADNPDLLPRKMQIRPDSPFYDWLDRELHSRFNYVCCEDIEELRRQPRALTMHGLIKSGGRRHEKDDRHGLLDRSRYVLGWSNEEKIRALEQEADRLAETGRRLAAEISAAEARKKAQTEKRDLCRDFLQIVEYSEINRQPLVRKIEELVAERRQIEESSDLLRSLRQQLAGVRERIRAADDARSKIIARTGGLKNDQQSRLEERKQLAEYAGFLTDPANGELVERLRGFQRSVLGDKQLTLRNVDKSQTEVREYINKQISNSDGRVKTVTETILRRMNQFKSNWPAETVEIDATLAAAPEYEEMLVLLKKEDLPRHEQRFKQLLNEGTINSIALFQNQLERERQDIGDKIGAINRSLRETEYNQGTYIALVMDLSQDPEIREFQQELKGCLTHSLGDEELYNEAKFLQVKKLIDRFNGREGLVDLDRRWTIKVTDVRNWFTFSAIERWIEDDRDKEYYSDSSGKSGGQKEKLAYTILASALAYQFGLEWGAIRSRSFRFVVIDEAFGKGSDESTRYGLELFKRLNLQLLIVTPLQKIQVIENYIHSVHFVHNEGGRNSQLRNFSIEEYRREKKRREAGDQSG